MLKSVDVRLPLTDRLWDSTLNLFSSSKIECQGFRPFIPETMVENLFDHSGDGLGPIRLTCSPMRLMAFSYRTNCNRVGALFISGGSVSKALHSSSGRTALDALRAVALDDGGLVSCQLISVVTPRLLSNDFEYVRLGHSEFHLIKKLSELSRERLYQELEIPLQRVYLRGWGRHSTPPECIVSAQPNSSTVELEIRWGNRPNQLALLQL